jgi:hypothetical protein
MIEQRIKQHHNNKTIQFQDICGAESELFTNLDSHVQSAAALAW